MATSTRTEDGAIAQFRFDDGTCFHMRLTVQHCNRKTKMAVEGVRGIRPDFIADVESSLNESLARDGISIANTIAVALERVVREHKEAVSRSLPAARRPRQEDDRAMEDQMAHSFNSACQVFNTGRAETDVLCSVLDITKSSNETLYGVIWDSKLNENACFCFRYTIDRMSASRLICTKASSGLPDRFSFVLNRYLRRKLENRCISASGVLALALDEAEKV